MTSQSASQLAEAFVPLAVLGASLAGSLHCIGMCGGLVTAVAKDKRSVALYHLGRLLGYGTLGAIAGFLGEKIFRSTLSGGGWLPWIAASALALSFIFLGIRVWREKPMHLSLPAFLLPLYFSSMKGLKKEMSMTAFSTGLFSVFLPCGWLHSFVLAAVATRSPFTGAAFLSLFWLGTLPALSIAPLFVHRVLQPIAIRAPKISGAFLVLAGVVALSYKVLPLTWSVSAGEHSQSGQHCPHPAHAK